MTISLADLIGRVPDDVERRVRRLRDDALAMVQDALRAECRLTMKTREDTLSSRAGGQAPIMLVPGCPEPLREVKFPPEYELAMLLSPFRGSLERTAKGADELLDLRRILNSQHVLQWPRVEERDLATTAEWARSLLGLLDKLDPLSFILQFNEDVLGAYRYSLSQARDIENRPNRAHIEIYWGAVGWFAETMNCTVEDLALVVITHELAHAYTQLGADIDGRRWNVFTFHESDVDLVEAIAQYYTHRVLRRLRHRYPLAFGVFTDFQKKQSTVYTAYNDWVDKVSPEAVRLAMLEVRRQGISTLDGFLQRLVNANTAMDPAPPAAFD